MGTQANCEVCAEPSTRVTRGMCHNCYHAAFWVTLSSGEVVTALVDTSVLIDYLRGDQQAAGLLERERAAAALHASEITRLEVWPVCDQQRRAGPVCCYRPSFGTRSRPRSRRKPVSLAVVALRSSLYLQR